MAAPRPMPARSRDFEPRASNFAPGGCRRDDTGLMWRAFFLKMKSRSRASRSTPAPPRAICGPESQAFWSSVDVSANIMLLSPEKRVQKALQLFDLMEKFVERAKQPPMSDQPLVYDPGGDLPVLVVSDQKSGFGRD